MSIWLRHRKLAEVNLPGKGMEGRPRKRKKGKRRGKREQRRMGEDGREKGKMKEQSTEGR